MMTRWAAVRVMCNSIYWLLFVGAEVCVRGDMTQTDSKCQFLSEQEVVHVALL